MSVETITTADGRTLAYEQVGDPAGAPILVLHGTPGCRLSGRHPDLSRVSAAGLRLVTYDRPGYGRSSRHPGRRVVDCVTDVAAIADELEIARFAVKGGSGGAPHALAVGARLPERVTRVACEVAPAPYDASGLDWWAGMDPANVKELQWALAGKNTLARELEQLAQHVLERIDDDPGALLSEFDLSHSDREVLDDPSAREVRRASTRESLRQGISGWVDDDLAMIKPWGFDVTELTVPVEIRCGATDVLVPPSHSQWLAAHIPHATVTIDEHGGHLSSPDQHLHRLRALVTA